MIKLEELIERVAQAMAKEHPNLLYLADARLVAKTAVDTMLADTDEGEIDPG